MAAASLAAGLAHLPGMIRSEGEEITQGLQLDQGLIFLAYNKSIQRQFEVVQRRLAGEPLTDYVTPVGGGYFHVPRGARGPTDWVGSTLLMA